MSVRGREWTPANTARASDVFAALLSTIGCSTSDPICGQVTGGEVTSELVAVGGWDSDPGSDPVALLSASELDAYWNRYPDNMYLTEPASGAVDREAVGPPEWVEGTQIVAFEFNDFYDGGLHQVVKFATADDRLTVELLHVPFCPEGGPEYGVAYFQLYRTPALGDPLVCETSAHCINY